MQLAIAAPISLRSYLKSDILREQDTPQVTLSMPDLGMQQTWTISELPWTVAMKVRDKPEADLATALEPDLTNAISWFLSKTSPELKKKKHHFEAQLAFLYLYMLLCSPNDNSYTYTLTSEIPIGAGLGSSASVSVCISTALLLRSGHLQSVRCLEDEESKQQSLDAINRWAFVGEMCIHGRPSGLDNTVATMGKAICFSRPGGGQQMKTAALGTIPELPLLIINSNISRSGATQIAKVRDARDSDPKRVDRLFDTIDRVTLLAIIKLTETVRDEKTLATLVHCLGELIQINHRMLAALGVSHGRLERVRHLLDGRKLAYTKLTGAGGGGCTISLLRAEGEALTETLQQLDEEGYSSVLTSFSSEAVKISVDENVE
ncbi:hypothetical protein AWENTII_006882 [Aspergillus wentii]